MAKNLKINIKNAQLAQAVNLGGLKGKAPDSKPADQAASSDQAPEPRLASSEAMNRDSKEDAPKIKARSKSVFAEPSSTPAPVPVEKPAEKVASKEEPVSPTPPPVPPVLAQAEDEVVRPKSTAELRRQIFGEDITADKSSAPVEPLPTPQQRKQPSIPSVFEEKGTQEPVAHRPAPRAPMPPRTPREGIPSSPRPMTERHSGSGHHTQSERASYPRSGERDRERSHDRSGHDRDTRERGNERSGEAPKRYPFSTPQRRPATGFGGGERAGERGSAPLHPPRPPMEKLGPTGRHIKDLLPPPRPKPPMGAGAPQRRPGERPGQGAPANAPGKAALGDKEQRRRPPLANKPKTEGAGSEGDADKRKVGGGNKTKDFRDVKPAVRKGNENRSFDARDRHGLRTDEDGGGWRKKRNRGMRQSQEDTTIRPTELKVRLPISVKDLAVEMKLKASQLVAKLFLQGVAVTLNDQLEDEVVIQLLGHEFGCEISIDRSEEQRIRITDKSIKEEIAEQDADSLELRAPIVTFMGHVDHGKTSLIDAIRKSNRVAGEAGAITQHIGAFRCSTAVGDIAILDTPGHEAFSAMRARGADVTDIVVLVVAGDEGIKQQTVEAIQHAKAAGVTLIVAINKSDKPNFNPETVYRQLADQDLLPEVWGGQIITINCSATTGDGVSSLLEMLALQAEILELKANPKARARGSVLESEMHKGLGAVATILVQNGTLNHGDALVFGQHWGRVKTMRNEFNQSLQLAGPSTPVEITGLSGLPEAGQEFIVVKNEKEAREIAEARSQGVRQNRMQMRKVVTMDNLFQQTTESSKKILNLILRADVQGSLEALKTALLKVQSEKVELNVIMAGVGEISESDVQMAEASKAVIMGFHTQIESHAEALIKQYGVIVHLHDIIYHAVDQIKVLMTGMLDKIAEEQERGVAEVKTVFKSSQYGNIAGCQVSEGSIHRNHHVRVKRNGEVIWKGSISSLKRLKDDVREVNKGYECGIVLNGTNDLQPGDLIEAYEVVYRLQEL